MQEKFNGWAALQAGGTLEKIAFDPGPMRPQQVQVRVESCGICHSDLSMIGNSWGNARFPLVPCHEVIGVIAAVGGQVKGLEVGGRKSVSGTPLESPATVATMLDFCARHRITPVIETFPMHEVNVALDYLRAGKARHRIVLKND